MSLFLCFENYNTPVRKPENKELQKGWLKQQVLVRFWEVAEARDLLRPAPYDAHGASEQVVELLDVLRDISRGMVVVVGLKLEFN